MEHHNNIALEDESYSLLIFEIEKIIVDYDEAADFKGIRLTDSNVKSALSKVKKHLEGGSPGFPESNEREKVLAFMSRAIIKMIDENFADEEEAEDEDAEESGPFAFENLVKTECCDIWICDDEDKYVMFSYERNSCHRNHDRYTLCSYHHKEKHPGHWKTCEKCKKEQESNIEMFAHMGTNEYNFEYLDEIPSSEPKRCQKCSKRINQGKEGHMVSPGDKYTCSFCNDTKIPDFTKSNKFSDKS